jgi:hypothetical protein|tara:strand:- start:251 stop:364 length:114 start_codon:yes stop_codon:yes gene_type:complete
MGRDDHACTLFSLRFKGNHFPGFDLEAQTTLPEPWRN